MLISIIKRYEKNIKAFKRGGLRAAKKDYLEGYDDGNYDGQVLGRSKEAFERFLK